MTPVLPAWQLEKGDTASEVSPSAVAVTTNVSTSDSTTPDTDSAEDVSCCENVKVRIDEKQIYHTI